MPRRAPGSASPAWALAGLLPVLLTHCAYPVAVRVAARRVAPARTDDALPDITVVVPAFRESEFIVDKVKDTLAQDYPPEQVHIVVVDDGSDDDTLELLEGSGLPVQVLHQGRRQGKSAALNRGVRESRTSIVVFTDANGSLTTGSLRAIVAPFADPRVAVVSGSKRPVGDGVHGAGESTYWRMEDGLRRAESAFGAVVGADGGIYAVRREAFEPIPPGVYADDYWIPLDALRRGHRVAHTSDACALESVSGSKYDDFERRTRIAAGIWRESLAHLDLLAPRHGPVAVAFLFHRVLRSLVVPALLPVVLVASARARRRSRVARALLAAQTVCWSAAAVGSVVDAKALTVPFQFGMTNVAALRGGARHLRRGQSGLWRRTERGPWR